MIFFWAFLMSQITPLMHHGGDMGSSVPWRYHQDGGTSVPLWCHQGDGGISGHWDATEEELFCDFIQNAGSSVPPWCREGHHGRDVEVSSFFMMSWTKRWILSMTSTLKKKTIRKERNGRSVLTVLYRVPGVDPWKSFASPGVWEVHGSCWTKKNHQPQTPNVGK